MDTTATSPHEEVGNERTRSEMLVKREFSAERMLAKKENFFVSAQTHEQQRRRISNWKTFAAFISAIASLHV